MNFWLRFRRSYILYSFLREPGAILSLFILLFVASISLAAPWIAPYDPFDAYLLDIMNADLPPAWMEEGEEQFFLGTDGQGRDLLSVIIYGIRTSFFIGGGAVLFQAVLGIFLGMMAGFYGGIIESFLMRLADIQLSFSTLLVAIFASGVIKASFEAFSYEQYAVPFLIFVIGIAEWPQYARTIRASVLVEKKKEYVEAVKIIGLKPRQVMWRHIFPNTLSVVLVLSTFQVANAILSEAALSFLGLGMPVRQPSLGSLIHEGFENFFSGSWWTVFFPGIALVSLILVINLLGDWLQDVLNPKLYKD